MDATACFSCSDPIQAFLGSFYRLCHEGMEDFECCFRFTCFVSAFLHRQRYSFNRLGSTILTIFQIPDAEDDPITRTAALLSLICALMSLSYGCMYIVRFGMMRNMFYASRWAEVSFFCW